MDFKRGARYTSFGGILPMKKLSLLTIFFGSSVIFGTPFLWGAQEQAPDPVVLQQERQMKDDAERQAQIICDSILGKGRSNVLVSLELGLSSTRKGGGALSRKMDSKSGLGDENYILPWVPAPKSVTKDEVPKDANVETQAAQQSIADVKTVLHRFDITVVHDDAIPADRIELAKGTLESAFSRYKKVLKIIFRASPFAQDKQYDPTETVKKNLWDSLTLKNFFLLFLLLLAFWLLKFFFGPLANFMNQYLDRMKDQNRSKVEMQSSSDNQTEEQTDMEAEGQEGELTEEQMAQMQAEEAAMEEKFEPFNFINDENVKQLAYLLHHEEPWIVALVMSYLSPEHAYKVMEALPADLQAKVALETAMYRQTSMDQVRTINDDIREKIDFVVGGLEKLVGILESSDRFSRDNVLEYLKNEKPGLYEKVRERIILFDDIVNFPKQAMQTIVRELKTEELGRALRNASPDIQQKFFDNMSQGAMTLLKEEIEYGRPVTEDQIEEERRKIVDLIKQMEADGKVSFRQKGQMAAITEDEIGSDVSPAGMSSILARASEQNAQKAEEAYAAGVEADRQGDLEAAVASYEEAVQADSQTVAYVQALANAYYSSERYEEALAAFEKVLELQPNEELKAWVDQLRISLSAAA